MITVFARSSDGAVWLRDYSGTSRGQLGLYRWADSRRYGTRGLLMGRKLPRRFAIGTDGGLYHRSYA